MAQKPVIFVSAVSGELGSARQTVVNLLLSQGFDPRAQDIPNGDTGQMLGVLRGWIDECSGVIQLVGRCFGRGPDDPLPGHGRYSYTQYEAIYAEQCGKPVWYIVIGPDHPRDGCTCPSTDCHDDQARYIQRLKKSGVRRFAANSLAETKNIIYEQQNELRRLDTEWQAHRQQVERIAEFTTGPLAEFVAAEAAKTPAARLAAYKRSLLVAFRPYQELAIDNYAAADQTAPDIWDIFVHPACSKNHLRPEEMDAAQRETPPRNPAVELLPLLAQDDHRRTVLLGDPGMGKSTLIQALIAHLADGGEFSDLPAFTGLLPVPLILRDLVPLLPQDQVEGWTWDSLLTVFIELYQREETAPKLCDAFKDHVPEFRQHLHTDAKVFFLIDGLDEIGDLAKRRRIVHCIQDGIKNTSKEARWLITSRVIGYDEAAADVVLCQQLHLELEAIQDNGMALDKWSRLNAINDLFVEQWKDIMLEGYDPGLYLSEDSEHTGKELVREHGWERARLSKQGYAPHSIPIAQRLYLAPFDDRRQDAFTQRWFQHRHSTDYSKELMREVRAHHHDGVRIISRVPNLLCLMNILKRSGKPLPDGRAALYDEIVKAYLGGIDAAYRLRPVLGNTCPFDAAQRRFLLALLGAHMQQQRVSGGGGQRAKGKGSQTGEQGESEGTILISKGEIATLLVPVIERLVAEGRVQSDHTAQALLDELLQHIASRSGLLIPRSSDEHGETLFGFTHLSFMEFFAAEWLGMEFDRLRNRIVRRSEAAADGLSLTEDDLDRDFPPAGPVQHHRDTFEHLSAQPAWHEPLIFLLESRKADAPTLLRWLFPALYRGGQNADGENQKSKIPGQEFETPLLPLDAVQLAVKLAHDKELALRQDIRQSWWRTLWAAYLNWPHPPWESDETKRWPIARLLLERPEHRVEVLQALVHVYPEDRGLGCTSPAPSLYLCDCTELIDADLALLTGLTRLERLDLIGCTKLKKLPDMSPMQGLRKLDLRLCSGLRDPGSLLGLTELAELEELYLPESIAPETLPDMSSMRSLKCLVLDGCANLNDNGRLKKQLPEGCLITGRQWKEL